MLSDSNFPIALLLTLIAGLSTGLGGVIVLLTGKFSTKTLSFALGFSAGVMLFISMTELFAEQSQPRLRLRREDGAAVYCPGLLRGDSADCPH